MSHELYKRYRPKKLVDLIGQPNAVKALEGWLGRDKLPHAIILHGPSGCGKTTIGRILVRHLKCARTDYHEINCADFRGIDTVRAINERMGLAPLGGGHRVYLIDEAHKLTNDAQNALLKNLEDTPDHVYFLLATTEIGKLINAVQTRCSNVAVRLLTPAECKKLITDVAVAEKFNLDDEVRDKIVEHARGSARLALVLLGKVVGLPDTEEQLAAIETVDAGRPAIELARALIFAHKPKWPDIAKILKDLTDEDPEGLRRMVLAYARTVMLGGKAAARCFAVINEFSRAFYDSGHPGLCAACYAVVHDPD